MSDTDAPSQVSSDTDVTLAVGAPQGPAVPPADIGSMLSRYVVLGQAGRGGMGRVLRAYDPKLQREVALKEVHRGKDAEATARLVGEARAMAKLSHPNVVSVFDVEELDGGKVVLVMEFIAGETLKQWLAQDRGWDAIVPQFIAAGRGLLAAHQAGVLHRDFKPANVLVGEAGSVKVTDFGIAKSTAGDSLHPSIDPDGSDETLTQVGSVMGTPRYMAPEQHAGHELGPRADQYAFCVALWEALCGAPPFKGEEIAKDKMQGPPSWPDNATPRRLADAVRRGLAKEPADRWPDMDALLTALSPTASRRKTQLALLALTAGVAAATLSYDHWGHEAARPCQGAIEQLAGTWDDARRDEVKAAMLGVGTRYAETAWTHAETRLSSFADAWASMRTEACEATTVRGEQSPKMLDLRMACLDRAALHMGAIVDVFSTADDNVVRKAHRLTAALPELSRCADTEALSAEVEPPTEADAKAVDQARAELARVGALIKASRFDEALQSIDAARRAVRSANYGPVRTEILRQEGLVHAELGHRDEAEASLRKALTNAAQWKQWDDMASIVSALIFLLGYDQERFDEALQHEALATGLVQDNPEGQAELLMSVASILLARGKYNEAEANVRAALELQLQAYGADDVRLAQTRNNLATILLQQGRLDEAETEFRASLKMKLTALGPDHPDLTYSRNNLALVLANRGEHAEAEGEFRTVIEQWTAIFGPEHRNVVGSRSNLAIALNGQGKHAEAEAEERAVLEIRRNTLGETHLDVVASRINLASILEQLGRPEDAEAQLRAALDAQQGNVEPDHPILATLRTSLAKLLIAGDRSGEALPLAEEAWARRKDDDTLAAEKAATAQVLAEALWGASPRNRARARDMAQTALEAYEAAEMGDAVKELKQWLADHPHAQTP